MTAGTERAAGSRSTAVCTVPWGPVGEGIARGLGARGWSVGCVGVGAAPATLVEEVAAAGGSSLAVACELDGRGAVRAALDEVVAGLGVPSLLVHGFPLYPPMAPRSLLDINEAGWTMVCDSTMKATLLVLQAAHDLFVAAGGPVRVVLLLPTFALSGAASHVPLAAAAEGVRALAKSAARQWGADGITVNCLAVDPAALLDAASVGAPEVSLAVPALPLGPPEDDLAPVVDWLAGEDAHFVTGQTLVLDGGVWMAR